MIIVRKGRGMKRNGVILMMFAFCSVCDVYTRMNFFRLNLVSSFFYVIALLRYNLHTIKFNHYNCDLSKFLELCNHLKTFLVSAHMWLTLPTMAP